MAEAAGDLAGLDEAGAGRVFAEAVAIMARLRGPGGCPWDREQTLESIRRYTLEETYEVLDAIERQSWAELRDELGDLLLQVLFYAEIAAGDGRFTIVDVVAGLNRKLVRRHPHGFGEAASVAAGNAVTGGLETDGIDAGQVLRNWEEIKKAERAAAGGMDSGTGSRLDGVLRSLPALMEAQKVGSKAAKIGFDWPDVEGVFAKLHEEVVEIREAAAVSGAGSEAVSGEVGDLLFTVVNLARHLGVDAEMALRGSTGKFRRRFGAMEQAGELEGLGAAELEALWGAAKQAE